MAFALFFRLRLLQFIALLPCLPLLTVLVSCTSDIQNKPASVDAEHTVPERVDPTLALPELALPKSALPKPALPKPALPKVSFEDFQLVGCTALDSHAATDAVVKAANKNALSFRISEGQPCTLILQTPQLRTLADTAWLSFMAEVDGFESPSANMLFWSDANKTAKPDLTSASALFPGLRAKVSFPVAVLAEGRGAPKTPGTLIQFSFGKGLDLKQWSRFGLAFMKLAGAESTVSLSDFEFSSEQPDYPVPNTPLIDKLGQWIQKDWKDKVVDEHAMRSQLQAEFFATSAERPEKYSQYGGLKSRTFSASGYFRTEHDGKRWWLVDPEGYGFYSIGVDIVGSGIAGNVDGIDQLHEWLPTKTGEFADAWETQTLYDILAPQGRQVELLSFHTANLIRAFGRDWHSKWTKLTRDRLIRWNVNSVGNWSDQKFARAAKIPYVVPLDHFPLTEKKIFRDFPDVFSDEYKAGARIFAQQLKRFQDDTYLIGYFMNNEPGWAYVPGLNLAEELLAKGDGFTSKTHLIDFLRKKYNGTIGALNTAWAGSFSQFADLRSPIKNAASLSPAAAEDLKAFSAIMLDKYVEVPVKACKLVDPNHLNMGMRWASGALKESWRFAGTRHLDVFSMNNYSDNPAPRLDLAAEMTSKPILIGEFHHGSMEAGHSAFGARWTKTEAERVTAYQYYAENAAQHPNSIGIHYFSYNDDPVLGRFDGQNFHQGFVSVTHAPYSDFVQGYGRVNDGLYQVVEGKRAPIDKYADGMVKSVPMGF